MGGLVFLIFKIILLSQEWRPEKASGKSALSPADLHIESVSKTAEWFAPGSWISVVHLFYITVYMHKLFLQLMLSLAIITPFYAAFPIFFLIVCYFCCLCFCRCATFLSFWRSSVPHFIPTFTFSCHHRCP